MQKFSDKIFLSPPALLMVMRLNIYAKAIESNWIAPLAQILKILKKKNLFI